MRKVIKSGGGELLKIKGRYDFKHYKPINYGEFFKLRELRESLRSRSKHDNGALREFLAIRDYMRGLMQLVSQPVIDNLVTTVGMNDNLDNYLAGSSYTAAFYLGLIDSSGYSGVAAGDTAASHAGWTENTAYDEATREAISWSSASSGSKASSADAEFSINTNSQTIKGAFLITNSTKGGSTGILFSAGLFTGGDEAVDDGDLLRSSYTASLS